MSIPGHRRRNDKNHKSIPFSCEDGQRMERLRQEIIGRITEMSYIMARTLDISPPRDIREFSLVDGPRGGIMGVSVFGTSRGEEAGASVEIITWGCTCHDNQVCCSDPCPPCE